MSWTPNLCKFNPKRWGYIGLIVEDFIKQSWKKERAIKPPAGVLIELRNFVESALKGFGTLPLGPKDIEIEIEDFIHNVMLIVQRTSSHLSYNDKTLVMKSFRSLENQLCVLEKSLVPTVVLNYETLDFFEKFFHELYNLGEQESERKRKDFNPNYIN